MNMYMQMYMHIYICKYVCLQICIYINMYLYIHICALAADYKHRTTPHWTQAHMTHRHARQNLSTMGWLRLVGFLKL